MKTILAFLSGVKEFRSGCTSHFADFGLLCAYDTGREMAHRLTLRRFDA